MHKTINPSAASSTGSFPGARGWQAASPGDSVKHWHPLLCESLQFGGSWRQFEGDNLKSMLFCWSHGRNPLIQLTALLWKARSIKTTDAIVLVPLLNSGILFFPADRMCEVTCAKVMQCSITCARRELKTGWVPNNKGLVKKIDTAVKKNEVLYWYRIIFKVN